MAEFTHVDSDGKVRMVDVSGKKATLRKARARAFVFMSKALIRKIRQRKIEKGDPLEICRVAGILAAKNTAQLIPLCHPVALSRVEIQIRLTEQGLELESQAVAEGKTGVEMEALTAVSVAALTVYDMCKAVDRSMVIGEICLLEKSGGRSGHFLRRALSGRNP